MADVPSDTSDQSSIDGIDALSVGAWLEANIAGAEPPFTFDLLAGGHSNLTYRFIDSVGTARVLRRPPLGHVLATAHDMVREHRIISGVGATDVPVPDALGACEDPSVNDAPFYVMSYVEGTVLHDDEVAAEVTLDERAALGMHVAEVLAELHSVNPDDVGLGDLGRKDGYIERQLRRWTRQWEQSKTRELPTMEDCGRLLAARIPDQIGSSIVHGDYRLGNMISAGGRVLAVLDWELCTLGDPMADVGYLMNNWVDPEEAPPSSSAPTLAGGFGSREEVLARYEELTGRDLSLVNYYRAFSHWRLAAIVEGVYRRYIEGVMVDTEVDPQQFREQVEFLAATSHELLTSDSV
jgi:aminoglycoside phosphotransferase (APT) family kinase protein